MANLGDVYRANQRYAEAERTLNRALAIEKAQLGPAHPDVAAILTMLAALYYEQGRFSQAEPLFKQSLSIKEKTFGPDNVDVVVSLHNLAALYLEKNRYADALSIIRKVISQGTAFKDVTFPVLFASEARHLISPPEALAQSYDVLQRSSSSAAGNAISKLAARFAAGTSALAGLVRNDQDLMNEAEQLDKLLIEAASKPPSGRAEEAETQLRDRLHAVRMQLGTLERAINERFPEYAALSRPRSLRLQESQHLLAEDEALVAFDFDAKSYAWIITKGDAAWIDLPISADGLKAQVKALRSSLTFDVNKPFDAELAFKLFQETFGALTDKLKGRTRISVVTNGALTSLPLQVLITSDPHNVPLKDINWLVRSYAITALPSVASLKTLRSKSSSSSAQKTMVGFADPIFSRQQLDSEAALRSAIKLYESEQPDLALLADRLPRLPETANEIRTVAHSLNVDEEDLYIGLAASVTSVKNAKLDHYRIVYFATHALLPEETKKFAKVKAEPALVLTLPAKPTDVDNGLLSASEVAQLKLDSDWVVLSACNTAAGDEPGAEALSGLARAFFYAGARSLIVSNWEVDSESTVSLMTGLFDALKANPHLSHAEALRLSMLQMINNGSNPEWADPKYWAPFVVVGEPQKN